MLITTETIPHRNRYDFWHHTVCEHFVSLDIGVDKSEVTSGLRAVLNHKKVAAIDVMQIDACRQKVTRRPQQIRYDNDENGFFLLSLQLKGKGMLEQDHRQIILNPGDITLFDSTRPYRIGFEENFNKLVLRIPRVLLQQHISAPENLCAYLLPASNIMSGFLSQLLVSLNAADDLPENVQPSLCNAILDMVSGTLQTLPQYSHPSSGRLHGFRLKRIKQYIELNITDNKLSLASISQAVGMSVSSLYRIFESEETSLSQYIWRRRLELCYRDLKNPALKDKPVSLIAFEWGFNHSTHFSRAFKMHYGLTPREFRATHCLSKPRQV